jgi:hypothetical protein
VKPTKPSAAERTISLFAVAQPHELPVEPEERTAKADVAEPLEVSADRWRAQTMLLDQWATKHFGKLGDEGNQFRLTHKEGRYYLEKLTSHSGRTVSSYAGLVIDGADLEPIARIFVDAVKHRRGQK